MSCKSAGSLLQSSSGKISLTVRASKLERSRSMASYHYYASSSKHPRLLYTNKRIFVPRRNVTILNPNGKLIRSENDRPIEEAPKENKVAQLQIILANLNLQEIESKENVTAKSSQVFNENINLIEESKDVEETLNSASGQITADVDADEDIMASIDIGIEDHQSKEEDTFVDSSKKLVSEESGPPKVEEISISALNQITTGKREDKDISEQLIQQDTKVAMSTSLNQAAASSTAPTATSSTTTMSSQHQRKVIQARSGKFSMAISRAEEDDIAADDSASSSSSSSSSESDSSDSDSSDSDDEDLKLEGGDGEGHRLVKSNSSNPGVMITKLGRKKLDKISPAELARITSYHHRRGRVDQLK